MPTMYVHTTCVSSTQNIERTVRIVRLCDYFQKKKVLTHKNLFYMEENSDAKSRSSYFFGDNARIQPLPFFKPYITTPKTDLVPVNPGIIPESCGFKIITGGLMGKFYKSNSNYLKAI